ncbi:hypothetical protein [Geodermatophilus sp. SYSU D00815]
MTVPAVLEAPALIPAPRGASEPVRRQRRQRPRDEYWDVFEARWVRPGR